MAAIGTTVSLCLPYFRGMKQVEHEITEGSNHRTKPGDPSVRLPVLGLLPGRPRRDVQGRGRLLGPGAHRDIRAPDLGRDDPPAHSSLREINRGDGKDVGVKFQASAVFVLLFVQKTHEFRLYQATFPPP